MQEIEKKLRSVGLGDLADAVAKIEDETLYDNEWLSMRRTPAGYVYVHQNKMKGHGVAVLAYRIVQADEPRVEVVGRYERVPCHHDDVALCALTGMIDPGEQPIEAAVRELYEESGIQVKANEMRDIGTIRPSKASDTTIHLYAVNVGDREIGDGPGDGTEAEAEGYCRWIETKAAYWSKDPTLATLTVRAMLYEIS